MSRLESAHLTRRAILWAALALPAGAMLAACAVPPPAAPPDITPAPASETPAPAPQATAGEAAQANAPLLPTPACGDDDDEPTLAQTEGPYYTPNTPERASLIEEETDGSEATRLLLTGFVLTTDCRPVARALLDFWHCDNSGVYDNEGYRFRGHQFTGEDGAYSLETIVPGVYPGRTRHIHVKVQAPNGPVLTTQLYFPDEPGNARDGIFRPELLVAMGDAGEAASGKQAQFSFVLA